MASKEQLKDGVNVLSTGVRVRVSQVNPALLTDVQMRIQNPPVPTRSDGEFGALGSSVPDPDHPDYVAECQQKDMERASAMMDVIALFCVELADGLPEDDGWLKKLRMLDRMGQLDLSAFDLDDEDDREFLYKKHVAPATEDWTLLFKLARVPQDVTAAMESAGS